MTTTASANTAPAEMAANNASQTIAAQTNAAQNNTTQNTVLTATRKFEDTICADLEISPFDLIALKLYLKKHG